MREHESAVTTGQFVLGLVLITIIVSIADFLLLNSAGVANSIGAGFGAVVGSIFLGAIVWSIHRLFSGANGAKEPKKFFLIFSAVICGLYVLLYGAEVLGG